MPLKVSPSYVEQRNEEGEVYGFSGDPRPSKYGDPGVVAGRDWSGDWSSGKSSYGSNMGYDGGYSRLKRSPQNAAPQAAATFKVPEFKVPKMEDVEYGEVPTFTAPEYDKSEVAKRAQKYAAPGVRKLRTAVQSATARGYDNPNVRRMTLRDALAGYGEGLENVMSGAQKTASAEYAQEYAYKYKEAGMNYQTAVQAVRDKYQGKMQTRGLQFRAEMAAVENVYKAELEAERYRVEEENRRQSFDYLYDEYKKGFLT